MKKLGNARIIACLEQRLGRVSGKGMLQLPSQTSSGCWDTIQKVLFVLVALRCKVSSSQHMACKYWSPPTPFTCFPFACLGKGYKMVFLQFYSFYHDNSVSSFAAVCPSKVYLAHLFSLAALLFASQGTCKN